MLRKMNVRNGARAPIKLSILFILIIAIPLVALGWAAWRILDHDRNLESDQLQKRLDDAANLEARELDHVLSMWEERLTEAAQGNVRDLPAGATVLVLDSRGLLAHYGQALPYYPPLHLPAAKNDLEEIERTEFQDLSQAVRLYESLSRNLDRSTRAGALMRLGRGLTKLQRFNEALKAYEELATMADFPVGDDPSELVARSQRIALFEKTNNPAAKSREADLLSAALIEGRFAIDRATFDHYSTYLPQGTQPPLLSTAEAVQELWPMWQQRPEGRSAMGEFVTTWKRTPAGTAAIVGSLDTLMNSLPLAIHDPDFRVAVEDNSGRAVWGSSLAGGIESKKSLRETDLPWTLSVSADNIAILQASAARRNLLAASFALMALVIAVASYLVFRSLTRELRVARLQSDFVSAVSHEFRTPLTAMRHLTDMLEEGNVSADRLPRYYGALGKETRRLHAMVESLLDFARMESGRRTYEMTETNAAQLAATLVEEFREQRHLPAHRIELREPNTQPCVRVDRDALTLALRNLVDNALKYSSESSTVNVFVHARDGFANIAVEDHGIGIGAREQRDIFGKFVRGTAATAFNVKGTGIGLTMAQQIVKAHGGRIEVASEPKQGSRFTIVLPLVAEPVSTNGVHV
jgi:signal transduction histidine kinase